jgi:hypothetical protein
MSTQTVYLVTSGDLRLAANQICWPAQADLEQRLTTVLADMGVTLQRAFSVDAALKHGFISSQRQGMDIFQSIPPEAPLLFATAAWQYSHHVLPGLRSHKGPLLTVANWSGTWPGLVGLLNLNGSLVKAKVTFSTLWSEDFTDRFFLDGLREWIRTGRVTHDLSHVRALDIEALPQDARKSGEELAANLLKQKAILGIFDEGCMGMYNAILDDELINPCGIFKERLSQSALVARMNTISDAEAAEVRAWLQRRGLTAVTGSDEKTELTENQLLLQCKMYIAAVRIAHEFGCNAIGIQYQQGLKDMAPASDLVEGLLNNPDRPPVYAAPGGAELYPNAALPHFNEVDEGAAVDALVTNICWTRLGFDPSTTLHDLRWGEYLQVNGERRFVWVLQISGAAPASHLRGGYAGASTERQPPMYFPLGGGTLKGVGKAGEIVWSRVFIEEGTLHVDLGRGSVVELDDEETNRRWRETTRQWPMVNTILHGVDRDQLMARHRANHISIAYAPDASSADHALAVKAAIFHAMNFKVHLCGETRQAKQLTSP